MLRTHVRSDSRSVVRSDNVKTVYPPTNTVCGGIKVGQSFGRSFGQRENSIPSHKHSLRGV